VASVCREIMMNNPFLMQMMGGAPNASALDAWGSAKGKG